MVKSRKKKSKKMKRSSSKNLGILPSKCINCRMSIASLREENARLKRQVSHDELTGVLSRQGFTERAEHLLSLFLNSNNGNVRRSHDKDEREHHLSVVFIDLNDFKPINDTFGHEAGDQLLVLFAQFLKTQVRDTDLIGRMGGDEFVLLLTESNEKCGKRVAKKIKETLSRHLLSVGGGELHLSASCGVASTSQGIYSLSKLMRQADKEMYKDKGKKAG